MSIPDFESGDFSSNLDTVTKQNGGFVYRLGPKVFNLVRRVRLSQPLLPKMHMKLLLEIENIVNEELGISKQVINAFNSVKSEIIKDSHKYKWEKNIYNNIVKNGHISNFEMFGKVINIDYTLFYLDSKQDFNDVFFNAVFNKRNNTLKTSLCYIKETNQYVDPSSQHEIEHIFQEILSNGNLLKTAKSNYMYSNAVYLAKQNDKYKKLVGFSIYYSFNFEKDAFANDIYSLVIQNPSENYLELLSKTKVFQNIKYIENKIKHLSNKDIEQITPLLKLYFNKTLKWWRKNTIKTIHNYKIKIGKAIAKAQYDLNKNGIIFDNFNRNVNIE